MSKTHHSPAIKWWVTAPGGITHTAPFVINGTHSSCITLCNRCDHFKLCIGVIAIEKSAGAVQELVAIENSAGAGGSCAVWHADRCWSFPALFRLKRGCLCTSLCLTGRFHKNCGFPRKIWGFFCGLYISKHIKWKLYRLNNVILLWNFQNIFIWLSFNMLYF